MDMALISAPQQQRAVQQIAALLHRLGVRLTDANDAGALSKPEAAAMGAAVDAALWDIQLRAWADEAISRIGASEAMA